MKHKLYTYILYIYIAPGSSHQWKILGSVYCRPAVLSFIEIPRAVLKVHKDIWGEPHSL